MQLTASRRYNAECATRTRIVMLTPAVPPSRSPPAAPSRPWSFWPRYSDRQRRPDPHIADRRCPWQSDSRALRVAATALSSPPPPSRHPRLPHPRACTPPPPLAMWHRRGLAASTEPARGAVGQGGERTARGRGESVACPGCALPAQRWGAFQLNYTGRTSFSSLLMHRSETSLMMAGRGSRVLKHDAPSAGASSACAAKGIKEN